MSIMLAVPPGFYRQTTNVAMLEDAPRVTTIYDKNDQEAGILSLEGNLYKPRPDVYHYP